MRKTTLLLAGVLAAALTLSACGSSSPLGNTAAPAGPTTGESPAPGGSTAPATPASSNPGSPAPSGTTSSGSVAQSGTESGSTSQPSGPGGPIVIGSGNFTESELLAGIYAAALKAKGVDASTHLDIGAREIYLKALADGSIDLFPEYTGGLLAYYDKSSTVSSPDGVYAALQKALPPTLQVLAKSPAEDQDSVTVTKATADKYHLTSIADLAPVAGQMTLGGSSEWQTRADGPPGLEKLYGVKFKAYTVLDPGGPLSVKGLKTGLVQATDIFTTDVALEQNDFVVLKDPKNLFLAQNVVPLITKSKVTPTIQSALDAVSNKLTTDDLKTMLAQINKDKSDPADVGAQWVKSAGLG